MRNVKVLNIVHQYVSLYFIALEICKYCCVCICHTFLFFFFSLAEGVTAMLRLNLTMQINKKYMVWSPYSDFALFSSRDLPLPSLQFTSHSGKYMFNLRNAKIFTPSIVFNLSCYRSIIYDTSQWQAYSTQVFGEKLGFLALTHTILYCNSPLMILLSISPHDLSRKMFSPNDTLMKIKWGGAKMYCNLGFIYLPLVFPAFSKATC